MDGLPGNLVEPPPHERAHPVGNLDDLPRIMITAEEAYPVLEALFLRAREEVRMGFRIFDPATPLYSAEGRAVGRDWFDLVLHTLCRGVDVEVVISDFDPVVASETHRLTWRSIRMLTAVRELARAAGAAGRLRAVAAMHPARVAPAARLALYGNIRAEVRERIAWLGRMEEAERARALAEMPGLERWIHGSGGRMRPVRWPVPDLVPATHHQKLAVFDRETLFIGGLDVNERRFDTKDHDRDAPQTWHDIQVLVGGREAADAHAHLGRFLDEVALRRPVAPSGGTILRTLSTARRFRGVSMAPEPAVAEIEEAHVEAVGRAERFVYLESQFFRSRPLAAAMARAARANPSLTCILMLPAAPEELAFEGREKVDMRYGEFLQARCLRKIRRAFGSRLFVGAPARAVRHHTDGRDTLRAAPIVYVHAKASFFDDRLCIISSANLNGRSFRWDTEAGVTFADPEVIRAFRLRCFDHWLPDDAAPEARAPGSAVGAWTRLAAQNAAAPPQRRRGFVMPYEFEPGERFGRDLVAVPEELV